MTDAQPTNDVDQASVGAAEAFGPPAEGPPSAAEGPVAAAAVTGPGPEARALKVGNVLVPVADLDAAIGFYSGVLGLAVRFRDGDRFAALDGGGVTVALVAPEEQVAGTATAPSYKVGDVAAAVAALTDAGAELVRGPETGPHETRAVLRDPSGNVLVLYSPS
jgi:predicted enzyme related to lactoylglutathione lyase